MAMVSLWSNSSYARVNVIFTGVQDAEPVIQPGVASKLLMDFGRKGRASVGAGGSPLAEELSGREIAERLTLAEGTVKNHVSNILSKLHAENRTHAANLARERKLI